MEAQREDSAELHYVRIAVDLVSETMLRASPEYIEAIRASLSDLTPAMALPPEDRSPSIADRIELAVARYPLLRDFGTLSDEMQSADSWMADVGRVVDFALFNPLKLPQRRKSVRHLLRHAMKRRDRLTAEIAKTLRVLAPPHTAEYVQSMLRFLEEQLPKTFDALPWQSVRNGAFSKIIRGFLGVHMYAATADADAAHWKHESAARQDLFALAYSYGCGYALVDNLVDTDFFAFAEDRDRFLELVERAVEGQDVQAFAPRSPYARELERLNALSRSALERRPDLRPVLLAFSRAQRADLALTHAGLQSLSPHEAVATILQRNALKAFWTRMCARRIGGGENLAHAPSLMVASLFNQLSNDFEGAVADTQYNQVTLFTHLVLDGPSPFEILVWAGARLVEEVERDSGVDAQSIADIFSVRLFEAAGELRDAAGSEYGGLISRFAHGAPQPIAEIAAQLGALGHHLPTPHQEMFLLGAIDLFTEELWKGRRSSMSPSRRLFIEVAERSAMTLERYLLQMELSDCARYALSGPCSRFRPFFLLCLAELAGVTVETAMPYAVAGECFHTASLVLDDLPAQDDSPSRRGKPSAHLMYGEAISQLAAVELISLGFSQLACTSSVHGRGEALVRIAHQYLGGPDGMCKGQLLDLTARDAEPDLAGWLRIARLKTGKAFSFCAALVGTLAEWSPHNARVVCEIAEDLGVLYQIRDDMADQDRPQDLLFPAAIDLLKDAQEKARSIDASQLPVANFLLDAMSQIFEEIESLHVATGST
jgi:geranylgeranyl pyrophosphate synthase